MPVGDVNYFAITASEVTATKITSMLKENEKLLYNAKYIGSDDDFLMNPSFREYFRKNAITPEDSSLFSINRSDLQRESSNVNGANRPVIINSIRNLWGILTPPRNNDDPSVLRKVSYLVVQILLVGYIAAGFALIKYVFAPNFIFIIGFLVILLLLFTILFLLDCEL